MDCSFIKEDKTQCRSNAMKESEFCYTHNPDISEDEKRQARQRGGHARALTVETPLPPMMIAEPEDAVMLVVDTINRVRAGELDIKTANCLGFLTDKLLKAFEVSRLNDRLELVENVMAGKRINY